MCERCPARRSKSKKGDIAPDPEDGDDCLTISTHHDERDPDGFMIQFTHSDSAWIWAGIDSMEDVLP